MPGGPIEVDLWTWPLDIGDEAAERLSALLDAQERARAARFGFARDRIRYIAGRAGLRDILGRLTTTAPAAVTFAYGDHGKPRLADRDQPAFNLSHSAGVAALAVSWGAGALGIDIEEIRAVAPDLARSVFSPRERAALDAVPQALRMRAFHLGWTRKEAVVKALGAGLAIPLDGFDVTLDPDRPAALTRFDGNPRAPADWRLVHLDLGPRLVGALAVETGGRPVEVRMRETDQPGPDPF